MAARSTWKGFLKLSLVSVPVKAYTTTSSSAGEVRLNQLHAECHSRINYKKTCPVHGEVPNDQIVSGYEYAKDQYVVIDTDELEKLRSEDDKAVKIDAFIGGDTLDPIYFNGKNYYLVPEGPIGQKGYQVLLQGMREAGKVAVATVVMHGKEQIGLVRPVDGLLVMTMLHYDAQVTKPAAFAEDVPSTPATAEEQQLAKMLIEASSPKEFDLAKYKDLYTERLTQLIEAKVAGKEIVAPPAHEQAQVINLMDALRKSVESFKKPETPEVPAAGEKKPARPPKKMAPSKGTAEPKTRKKKSS